MTHELISLLLWLGIGALMVWGHAKGEKPTWFAIWAFYCATLYLEAVSYAGS